MAGADAMDLIAYDPTTTIYFFRGEEYNLRELARAVHELLPLVHNAMLALAKQP